MGRNRIFRREGSSIAGLREASLLRVAGFSGLLCLASVSWPLLPTPTVAPGLPASGSAVTRLLSLCGPAQAAPPDEFLLQMSPGRPGGRWLRDLEDPHLGHPHPEYDHLGHPHPEHPHPCAATKKGGFPASDTRVEPTPDQKLYDVLSCHLDLSIDPSAGTIQGRVKLRLEILPDALGDPVVLGAVELDLRREMAVHHTRIEGIEVEFDAGAREDDLLRIIPNSVLASGHQFTVEVDYGGAPPTDGWSGFHFREVSGSTIAYSFGSPRGARCWWPCKDYPEDKADSVRIDVTVPGNYTVAANGRLTAVTEGEGSRTFFWEETHPIASYLVAVAAYPYEVTRDLYTAAAGDTMPLVFYNYPESVDDWTPVQSKVASMIAAFAGVFGEYPFLNEKYGHAQIPFSGGMEHQTITCLGSRSETVVAHELAHQWWGDALTCADFHHIWLNEGFATYCQSLWRESTEGPEGYWDEILQQRYYGPGKIYVDEIEESDRIYDTSLSYYKGAWVLHMLRRVLGDTDFFEALRVYFGSHRGGTAVTEDLQAAAEQVSDRSLEAYFRQWIYGEGFPIYTYDWSTEADGAGWELRVRLRQIQSEDVFEMPVDLGIMYAGSTADQIIRVENASADTVYTIQLQAEPVDVHVDPEQWILRQVIPPLGRPAFDRPILLVNGVPWSTTSGDEVRPVYGAESFTGEYAYDFWDYHQAPRDGYPAPLPSPLGHGAVPGDILGRYQAVIWVGNNYGGDGQGWLDSPLHGYLEAGGNVLLMTLSGRTFLPDPYAEYLEAEWEENDGEAEAYKALHPGLPDLRLDGEQDPVSFLRLDEDEEIVPLYAESEGEDRYLGAVRLPESGVGGGAFAFLSGRPYRWNADDLRTSIGRLLEEFLLETPPAGSALALETARPNPFRNQTAIRFLLPQAGSVRLDIWDVQGRRVRVLRDGPSPAGWNAEVWDGLSQDGREAASGVYFCRLKAPGGTESRRVLRIR